VWTFGHSVREIERSHHQVVVEETATKGAAILFGAFALLDLVGFRRAVGNEFVVGVVLAFFMAGLALYAAISSSFVADRTRRALIIKRRIGILTRERVYDASIIDRIFVRATLKAAAWLFDSNQGEARA
jgi:hypothetical protein